VVVAALAVVAVGQGGFYLGARVVALLLLALAGVGLVVAGWRSASARGRKAAAWAVLRPVRGALAGLGFMATATAVAGLVDGHPRGALSVDSLLFGLAVAVAAPAAVSASARRQIVDVLLALGVLLAVTGWVGVTFRYQPLGHPDGGLWRAATTVTYANASAAALSMVGLLGLATLSSTGARSAACMVIVTGLGATLSRAGIASFAVGLLLLGLLVGWKALVSAAAPVLGGAAVAVGLMIPGMKAAQPARPVWAALGLAAGVAIAAAPWRRMRRLAVFCGVGGVAVIAVLSGIVALDRSHSWAGRASLSSPDRSAAAHAALHLWTTHPLAGVGPGRALFLWSEPQRGSVFDRFAHDEYLQLVAEQGAIGLVGLAGLAAGASITIAGGGRRLGRRWGLWAGSVAGLTAFAVHSSFDFLWHIPLVPLLAAVSVGLAAPLAGAEEQYQQIPTPDSKELECVARDG
jgi:hypothetical protein